jgi:hypothetical protein
MNANAFHKRLRFALVVGVAGLCSACSSVESIVPSGLIPRLPAEHTTAQANVAPSDKIVKLPLRPEDLDCPSVDIEEGGASLRVGGAENASVRYQFDIAETARECAPQGNSFSLKVGVSGHLLIGPAGSPGAFSAPLRITVRRESDQKPAYTKTYKIETDTAGAAEAQFQFVSEPIILPMAHSDLNNDYSIVIGFDNSHAAETPHPHRKHVPKASEAH